MIVIKDDGKWDAFLKKCPKFTTRSCNRKSNYDVYIMEATETSVVLFNTQHSTVSVHGLVASPDGKLYVILNTCGHTERIWIEFPAEPEVEGTIEIDNTKAPTKKIKIKGTKKDEGVDKE